MPTSGDFSNSDALPSAIEELLLHAAVGNTSRAAERLAAWKRASNLSHYSDISFAATRLLPLVYTNLGRDSKNEGNHQQAEPWLGHLMGLHRYHWLQNANRQRDVLEIVAALTDAGVDSVLLGGLPLVAVGCFDDLGERPLMKRQILISPQDATRAREILIGYGWRPPTAMPPVPGWKFTEWWRSGANDILRVRFQWLPKGYPPASAERVLRRSSETTLSGTRVRVPDATDQLLLSCVWNRRQTLDGSYRFVWAADAMRVLQRTEDRIDWDRLLRESQELKILYPIRGSLQYLRDTFHAPVPETFLNAAHGIAISNAECELFWKATGLKPARLLSQPAKSLTRPYREYFAAESAAERAPTIGGFLRYWTWRMRSELNRPRKAS